MRESSAAIAASSSGRFDRRLLTGGLGGAFRAGARTIDGGRAAMREAAHRLESVADASRASGTVSELRVSSDDIRRAVDIIGQIAAQTRLLSLNATIEAARAGEAGQGSGWWPPR